MSTALLEPDLGSGDEIDDGSRHEGLASVRSACDAGADVNGDPSDVVASELHFPRMDAGTDPK